MYRKIIVAYEKSEVSDRAVAAAIEVAKVFRSSLHAVVIVERLPSYTAYVGATNPEGLHMLKEDQMASHRELLKGIKATAAERGVALTGHFVDASQMASIAEYLHEGDLDLLVLGLHQHSSYVARLFGSIYNLAQTVSCSVLGVR